ncbi:MAG: hypothetical protein Q9191_007325 [Dirinaria sp. TL-2023a]
MDEASVSTAVGQETLKNKRARKQAERNAGRLITTPWIRTQLRFYGIKFNPRINPFKAKVLLLRSVADGLCDSIPPQILEIKQTLKEEYEGIMSDYHDRQEACHVQELRKRRLKFQACATQVAEAECDPSLFLRKYFLNENGDPARPETRYSILLRGYTNRDLVLTRLVERVPGLHVADCGGDAGKENCMYIGWDRGYVNNNAYEMEQRAAPGVWAWRLSSDLDRLMEVHQKNAKELHDQKQKIQSTADGPFKLRNGMYVLRCALMEHERRMESKQMQLRIVGSGELGVFDLGRDDEADTWSDFYGDESDHSEEGEDLTKGNEAGNAASSDTARAAAKRRKNREG